MSPVDARRMVVTVVVGATLRFDPVRLRLSWHVSTSAPCMSVICSASFFICRANESKFESDSVCLDKVVARRATHRTWSVASFVLRTARQAVLCRLVGQILYSESSLPSWFMLSWDLRPKF